MKKLVTFAIASLIVVTSASANQTSQSNNANAKTNKLQNPKVKMASSAFEKDKSIETPLFRTLDPDNILIMEFETGPVTFELAEFFAPNHVKRVKDLVREGFYDGLPLYRVIENFVVQGGDSNEQRETQHRTPLKNEFTRSFDPKAAFTLVQTPDLLAQQTGFIHGFAIGRSITEKKEWMIHCPGTINLGRTSKPDSATTDFAIMFGQATRHLDRNMSAFGRIIDGWSSFYQVKRAPIETGGVFSNQDNATKIKRAYLFGDTEQAKSTTYLIENTEHQSFKQKVAERRKLSHEFFNYKGNGNLDICYLRPTLKIESK